MRTSIAVWVGLVALLLGGCKISSDRISEEPSTDSGHQAPSTQTVVLQGRVNKGVVRGAKVALFPLSSAQPMDSAILAEAITDENGRFSLEISSTMLGQPGYLVVTGIEGQSEIICDVGNGCDNYAFGDAIPLNEDFRLSLAAPVLRSNTSFNVTLLTHLAAQLVLDAYSNHEENIVVDRLRLQMEINQANSRVASRFGVIGDLVSLDTADLTSQDEVAQAGNRELWYSAIGAGVWQASLEANPSEPAIEDIIRSFESLYLSAGLRSHRQEGDLAGMLSYEQILDGARDTILYLQDNMSEVEVSSLLTEINTARGLAASETDNQPDLGAASATAVLTDVGKAQSLIDTISKVTAAVNLPRLVSLGDISSLTDPKVSAAIEQFGFELSAAQIIDGKRSEQLLSGSGRILNVVLNSTLEVLANPGGPTPTRMDGIEFSLNHSASPDNPLREEFKFQFFNAFATCDDGSADCWLEPNLEVLLITHDLYADLGGRYMAADRFEFTITGGAKINTLSLGFPETAKQRVIVDIPKITDNLALHGTTASRILEAPREGKQDGSEGGEVARCSLYNIEGNPELMHYQLETGSVDMHLPISLMHDGGEAADEKLDLRADLILSSGPMNIELFNGKVECNDSTQVKVHVLSEIQVHELVNLNLSVNAAIENATKDKSFIAALGLSQAKSYLGSPITYWDAEDYRCANFGETDFAQCQSLNETSGFLGETVTNFLPLTASVGVKANLSGLADPVLLEVSGAREGPVGNRIDRLKLRYPGQAISLNGTFNVREIGGRKLSYMASMNAVNLDGTNILLGLGGDGERSGKILNSLDEEIATITDMGQWLKVVFDDGSFKSLCGYC